MFDLHAAIRSCRVLFSISNAFIKLGSSQFSSFSAFTAIIKASEMLITNLTIQLYADSALNGKFGFRTYLISIRDPSSSNINFRPFHVQEFKWWHSPVKIRLSHWSFSGWNFPANVTTNDKHYMELNRPLLSSCSHLCLKTSFGTQPFILK